MVRTGALDVDPAPPEEGRSREQFVLEPGPVGHYVPLQPPASAARADLHRGAGLGVQDAGLKLPGALLGIAPTRGEQGIKGRGLVAARHAGKEVKGRGGCVLQADRWTKAPVRLVERSGRRGERDILVLRGHVPGPLARGGEGLVDLAAGQDAADARRRCQPRAELDPLPCKCPDGGGLHFVVREAASLPPPFVGKVAAVHVPQGRAHTEDRRALPPEHGPCTPGVQI